MPHWKNETQIKKHDALTTGQAASSSNNVIEEGHTKIKMGHIPSNKIVKDVTRPMVTKTHIADIEHLKIFVVLLIILVVLSAILSMVDT